MSGSDERQLNSEPSAVTNSGSLDPARLAQWRITVDLMRAVDAVFQHNKPEAK